MDRVHVMYESLHRLVNTAYSHIDGVLDHSVCTLDSDEFPADIVIDLHIVKARVILSGHLSDLVKFLLKSLSHVRSHVEVKCRNSLTSVHLVLDSLHGDTSEDAGSLDPFCRAGLSMSCEEAFLENLVKRMLDAGKTLGRVIVLVMDMDVIVLHGFLHIF